MYMEENLNHNQSMTLINEMIRRAKNNFRKGSMNSAIFWGYLTATLAVADYVLLHVLENPHNAHSVWWLTVPGLLVSFVMERRLDRKMLVKMHLDRIIGFIWKGFTVSIALFLAIIFTVAFILQDNRVLMLITPVILLATGTSMFATAATCRSRMLFVAAAIFWTGSVLCFIPFEWFFTGEKWTARVYEGNQLLIFAVCMIAGIVIPGHLENRKAEKHDVSGT
jgi:K+-sensing histidine kinase KdpD